MHDVTFSSGNVNREAHANAIDQSARGYIKIGIILLTFLFIMLFRSNVVQRIIVYGDSMQPTLMQDDVCFAKKFDIKPRRYDIVTVKVGGQTIIKRVIGLPGDVLEIKDGYVFVNGNPVQKEYNFFTTKYGVLESLFIVGENEYFLMGDNREVSYDSREIGSVKIDKINGIVICRIFPFWDMKKIPHGEERGDINV